MDLLQKYRQDPCGTLSIPYWKHLCITVPENMLIVHDKQYSENQYAAYMDETYFRLFHSLERIPFVRLKDYCIETAAIEDIPCFAEIINKSYTDISVTFEQLLGYTRTKVYNPSLWVKAIHVQSGKIVGCGIAEIDNVAEEGILEWVQVLPSYRGKKIGQMIVNELLMRLKSLATFTTVSGRINNPTRAEILYRKCGFTGSDIWHILRKKV